MEAVSHPATKKTRAPRAVKDGATLAKQVSELPLGQFPAFVEGLEAGVRSYLKTLLAGVK